MQSSVQSTGNTPTYWDFDFEDIRKIVTVFGTEDDVLLFETLLEVYKDQWSNPEELPDSRIVLEAARRLGKNPNTLHQQLRRMRERTKENAVRFLVP